MEKLDSNPNFSPRRHGDAENFSGAWPDTAGSAPRCLSFVTMAHHDASTSIPTELPAQGSVSVSLVRNCGQSPAAAQTHSLRCRLFRWAARGLPPSR